MRSSHGSSNSCSLPPRYVRIVSSRLTVQSEANVLAEIFGLCNHAIMIEGLDIQLTVLQLLRNSQSTMSSRRPLLAAVASYEQLAASIRAIYLRILTNLVPGLVINPTATGMVQYFVDG